MSDSSNICLECGLCCNGTLIGFVQVEPEELPEIRKIMNIEEERGHGFFLQPCSKFCDGCTIYSQRPKQCDLFKCGLLNAVEQKALDFDLAVEKINVVKLKKVALEKKLAQQDLQLKSHSFYFKMVELNKVMQKIDSEATLTQNQQELFSDLLEFNKLVSKEFDVTFF